MATRQQLEQQLVAAHRSGNVQAAQQAAYNIRAYDTAIARGGSGFDWNVPSINAPPPIERVPKPSFGSWLENVGIGIGDEWGRQIQGLGESVQRGVSAFAKDPLKASAAAFMTALEPARQGFTQPVQTAKGIGTGIAETVGQMGRQAASGPIGFGQVVGQVVDMPGPDLPGGKRRPTMAELDVYHGTPHTFDPETGAPLGRFRSSKIGTGEGAQAYGYGLYLAEHPDTAEGYAWNLGQQAGNPAMVKNVPLTDLYAKIQSRADRLPHEKSTIEYQKLDLLERLMQEQTTPAKVLANAAEQEGWNAAAIDWFKNEVAPNYKGHGTVYKVDLPDAKIEQMLDWDKPLSEQPKAVQNMLASADLTGTAGYIARTPEKTTAGELYNALANNYGPRDVSEYFRKAGIPGIKYLDAGSRDGGKGTRNFVVFPGEEQSLTILERDGVKAEVPKPAAPKFDLSVDSAKGIRETKVGNTQISYGYDGNIASIASIRTPSGKRNQGSARAAMEQFLAETDALGIPVKLESSPLDKRTTDARLFNFYKSLGFEPTGRKINAVGDPEMIRQPRTN